MMSGRSKILIFSSFLLALAGPVRAFAGTAASFTLDGRLFEANSSVPLNDTVTFRVQILNGDKTCVLYEETQDRATSSGYFNLQVGSINVNDPKRSGGDSHNPMSLVFQNSKPIPASGCASPYTPQPGEVRYVRITVIPQSTAIAQTMSPDLSLDSVPSAMVAETLQGSTPDDFIRADTIPELTQNAVEDLVKGDSLLYLRANSNGASLPVFSSNPSSPSAGQMWFDSSGVIKFYNGSTVQTLGVSGAGITSLTAGTGLSGGTITASGTISLASLHGSAGTAVKTNYDVYGRVTGSTALTAADIPAVEYATLLNTNGLSPWPTACGAAQFLRWESTTDVFVCDSVSATQITAGLGYTPVNKAGDTMTGALALPADGLTVGTNQLVTSGGKVGIGTTTPLEKLEVVGGKISVSGTGAGFKIGDAILQNGANSFQLNTSAHFSTTGLFAVGTTPVNGYTMRTNVGFNIQTDGNVGIGTSTASRRLHVSGTGADAGIRVDRLDPASGPMNVFARYNTAGTTVQQVWGFGFPDGTNFQITDMGTAISGVGNPRFTITPAGNVGIGTANPLYTLDVNGSLNATALSLNGNSVVTSNIAVGGGSSGSFTQNATDVATAARSALTLQNKGTGGANEYNLVMKNAAGTTTASVTQDGTASFATSVVSPTISGSAAASANLTLDSTSHGTKGNIILAPNGGYVGIGTAAPYTPLHVNGNSLVSGTMYFGAHSTASGNNVSNLSATELKFNTNSGASGPFSVGVGGKGNTSSGNTFTIYGQDGYTTGAYNGGDLVLRSGTKGSTGVDGAMIFKVGTSEIARLSSGGNVGIGTTVPDAKLDVYATGLAGSTGAIAEIAANSFDNLGSDPTLLKLLTPIGGTPRGKIFTASNNVKSFEISNTGNFVTASSGTYANPMPVNGAGSSPYTLIATGLTSASHFDGATPVVGNGVNVSITGWGGSTPGYRSVYGMPVKIRAANPSAPSYAFYADVAEGSKNWAFYGASGDMYVNGNVGIGTATPTNKLEVTGTVKATSFVGNSNNAGSATAIDWSLGNSQYTSADCGAITFSNMVDGGAYTLTLTGANAGTCSFSHAGLTFKYPPNHGVTTAGTMTVYSFQRVGSMVMVAWITGY